MLDKSIHSRSKICKEIILLFAVFFFPGIILQPTGFNRSWFGGLGFNVEILVQAVPQFLLLLFILEIQDRRLVDELGLSFRIGRDLPIILGGSVGLFIVIGLVANIGGLLLPVGDHGTSALASPVSKWNMRTPAVIPMIFVSSLAIGYREELFFRAYLIMRLDQLDVAPAASVAASAVLFAAGHLYEGPVGAASALVSGAFLALLYRRFRNLHQVALSHALYNFGVLVLSGTMGGHGA
jgi:membrane protease YdiL (CAAX protease family)